MKHVNKYFNTDKKIAEAIIDAVDMIIKRAILKPKPIQPKLWHLYIDANGNTIFIFNKKGKKLKGVICNNNKLKGTTYLVKEIADLSGYFK